MLKLNIMAEKELSGIEFLLKNGILCHFYPKNEWKLIENIRFDEKTTSFCGNFCMKSI